MAGENTKKRMGRPPKEIDPQTLLRFLQIYPTKKQTATFFDCSEAHIEDECDRLFECTFSAIRERQADGIKRALMGWCLKYAKQGNHNLIQFAMKNINGWTDRPEIEQSNSQVIELRYSIDKDKKTKDNDNGQKQISGRAGDAGGETKED